MIGGVETAHTLPLSNVSTPSQMWDWLRDDFTHFLFTHADGKLN